MLLVTQTPHTSQYSVTLDAGQAEVYNSINEKTTITTY
jgi:hypothetical protein